MTYCIIAFRKKEYQVEDLQTVLREIEKAGTAIKSYRFFMNTLHKKTDISRLAEVGEANGFKCDAYPSYKPYSITFTPKVTDHSFY